MTDSGASTSPSLITTKQPERSLNRQVVLEEDEYTEALSKIIARDFFPSLAHLEATNTFFSSLESQDPEKIQESVRRFSDLRATPHIRATPYGKTPYDTPLRTPRENSSSNPGPSGPPVDLSLSLDAFQAKYTSEDNSSFTDILDEENRRRRQKYAWAWDAESRVREKKAKEIETRERLLLEGAPKVSGQRLMVEGGTVASIEAPKSPANDEVESGDSVNNSEAGALILSQPSDATEGSTDVMAPRKDTRSAAVPGWRFKTRNSLMFPPDADIAPYHPPQSTPNKSDDSTPMKEAGRVIHASTRLPEQSEEVPSMPASPTRSRIGAAISGTPYHRKVDDTPKVGGYGFVDALPSPSPSELGPDAMKELMTWGTLLATPRIIHPEDDISGGTSTSRASNPFTIAHPSSRDAIGRKLGGQAGRSLRDKAVRLSTGVIGTPHGDDRKRKSDMPPPAFTPRRSGVANAELLSPAARNLLGRTKSGGVLGLSPRPPSTPANKSYGLGNKRGRKGKEVDLSKVGWSPMSTPVSRSRRDR